MIDEQKTKEQLIEEIGVLRKRTAELEKSEIDSKQAKELFDALSISSPIGIYIIQDGKFVLGNPQFQIYTGYSEEELSAMDPLMLVISEDRDMVRDNATMMLKGERSAPYEYRVIDKDGNVRWIMESVTTINYHGRKATLGNFMDITERKQAEVKLKEHTERLKGLEERITELKDAHEQLIEKFKQDIGGILS